MDRATLSHAKSQVAHCTQVKSPGSKRCERYLKHIATQTVTCWLLAHTYTARPKLHLVDLFHFFGRHTDMSTVVQTKISHVSKTTPLLGVICHPFGKT